MFIKEINYNYCNLILIVMIVFMFYYCFIKSKKNVEYFNIVSDCKEIEHVININTSGLIFTLD